MRELNRQFATATKRVDGFGERLSHFIQLSHERMQLLQKTTDFLEGNQIAFSDQFIRITENLQGMEDRILRQIDQSITRALNKPEE